MVTKIGSIIILLFLFIIFGCKNTAIQIESEYVLLQERAISYSTSLNNNSISYLDLTTFAQTLITQSGDTTNLPFSGFENLLSNTGDTLFFEREGKINVFDIRNDSLTTIIDSSGYDDLRLIDLNSEGTKLLLLGRVPAKVDIICLDIATGEIELVKKLNSTGVAAMFAYPRFNFESTKVAYNDLNKRGEWTTFILNLSDNKTKILDNETFFGWVNNPSGMIVLKKVDNELKTYYISDKKPNTRVELLHQLEMPNQPSGKFNGIPYLSVNNSTSNVEVLTLESDRVIGVEKIELNPVWQSNVSWNRTNDKFIYLTGQGLPGNLFEVNKKGETFSKTLENVYRFGSHAINLEVSPDGKYCLFQGRELFKDVDTLNDNGIFIYDLEKGEIHEYHSTKGDCPGAECYEWPSWISNKELVYSHWYQNSIDAYNIETGESNVLYTSPHKEQHTSIAHLSGSPDGRFVAFIEWSYEPGEYKLNILNIETGIAKTVRVFESIAGTLYGQPLIEFAWTKDAKNVYYCFTDNESNTLKLFNYQLSEEVTKIVWERDDSMPVGLDLNSNGTKLVLTSSPDVNNEKVYQLKVRRKL